ncbi:hypothetical protein [Alloyangia pacifica]|uniref:Uncharacterized protein n=1 Tax=Alloyangia pacifica TaxID=311180 RepID=A0A1I6PR35_9RHOB|nr:hypothetical protein [Alloyangia pacifica]SDG33642.1 hypothetical protein SAMN04488245_102411 [Alloyangia pacifica]SFS42679.1 hypothetical protein SAMN04488050_101712 [Alloyangia pacifica]
MTASKEAERDARYEKAMKEIRAKRRADPKKWADRKLPALREDVTAAQDAFLYVLSKALYKERDLADERLDARLAAIDGKGALLGAGRTVARANIDSVVRAVEPVTQRRAVISEGRAPQWAEPLFTGGTT